MKMTIDHNVFEDAFRNYGRLDQFSRKGLRLLFEYLEELENDIGYEIELDVIGLCCYYSEDTIENVLKEHDLESIEDLRDHTAVIQVDDETIIYQAF